MGKEDLGGCSRSSSSSSDGGSDGRPFKKARYVWEVKGKYHLKPTQGETDKNNLDIDNNEEQEDSSSSTSDNNKCCIESFLAKTDSFFMNLSDDESDSISKNIDQSLSNEIPITLVTPNPKNQDYYLRRWQSRQIARAYIENTINKVLESWIVSPLFDATDFVENCDNDGRIEDEGILLAIQSHGLQANDNVVLPPTANNLDQSNSSTIIDNQNVCEEKNKEEIDVKSSEQTNSEDCNQIPNFNCEFMDAAVCVAIKRKGLSSYKY